MADGLEPLVRWVGLAAGTAGLVKAGGEALGDFPLNNQSRSRHSRLRTLPLTPVVHSRRVVLRPDLLPGSDPMDAVATGATLTRLGKHVEAELLGEVRHPHATPTRSVQLADTGLTGPCVPGGSHRRRTRSIQRAACSAHNAPSMVHHAACSGRDAGACGAPHSARRRACADDSHRACTRRVARSTAKARRDRSLRAARCTLLPEWRIARMLHLLHASCCAACCVHVQTCRGGDAPEGLAFGGNRALAHACARGRPLPVSACERCARMQAAERVFGMEAEEALAALAQLGAALLHQGK